MSPISWPATTERSPGRLSADVWELFHFLAWQALHSSLRHQKFNYSGSGFEILKVLNSSTGLSHFLFSYTKCRYFFLKSG